MSKPDGGEEGVESWLSEAIISFLQGPCYTTPLMGFIDANCAVFDTDEEMKLEYTAIHERFKTLVEDLLVGFLDELGVDPATFVRIAATCTSDKVNEFVVASILTVDDFMHFRNMMLQRNVELTNQVLEQLELRENTAVLMWG